MVEWELKYTKKSKNDSQLLKSCHLDGKAKNILNKIKEDPYGKPPPFDDFLSYYTLFIFNRQFRKKNRRRQKDAASLYLFISLYGKNVNPLFSYTRIARSLSSSTSNRKMAFGYFSRMVSRNRLPIPSPL